MMTNVGHPQVALPLTVRRAALLTRIQAAREETAIAGRLVAEDLRKTERSILSGWKLLKITALAAGLVWVFSAASQVNRGRRFLTLAISLLSIVHRVRRIGALLTPLAKLIGNRDKYNETRSY